MRVIPFTARTGGSRGAANAESDASGSVHSSWPDTVPVVEAGASAS